MAKIEVYLPAMGEGVIEATVNKWLVPEGASISEDDPLVEVATDKVDSEVPSPAKGVLVKIVAAEGSVPKVGDIIAIIENEVPYVPQEPDKVEKEVARVRETIEQFRAEKETVERVSEEMKSRTPSGRFLSPLVRNIAAAEGIGYDELETIAGTGMDGRITKDDLLSWIEKRKAEAAADTRTEPEAPVARVGRAEKPEAAAVQGSPTATGDKVIEMDRVRKLIAEHMTLSKRTSAHVTSYIDADVTRLVNWRNRTKQDFLEKEGVKLTLTPIFIDATARALKDYPMLNSSVDGNKIILRKNINIGMATALPDGNLIVPVIKNCDEKSLTGIARAVNDLADRARRNKLKPDEITGGTFTLTNFGSYDNLAGTPIISQPQVAILGTGAVRKTPAVIETPEGDLIGIRQIMILSLSYDHRIIDGALAGKFLRRVKEILENYEE
ncbi:MAG: dihydrolipoamide acetyltransferase family protein [Bacteroidales bacterium]|jgi:2-oxoglutarate dehydrogenase E2 component (dihydrolipoamide succinyltransferase)|nr:dihydrolipoamide acetyltransferase family protein [Bacteroidales bacterium]